MIIRVNCGILNSVFVKDSLNVDIAEFGEMIDEIVLESRRKNKKRNLVQLASWWKRI